MAETDRISEYLNRVPGAYQADDGRRYWTREQVVEAVKECGTPPPRSHVMGSELRWISNPFDAYQHFTDDTHPYMIEFSRGSWRLTIGDRFLGNLVSLRDAKDAAEKDRAALSAEVEG